MAKTTKKTTDKAIRKTTKKTAKRQSASVVDVFGLALHPWIGSAKVGRASDLRGRDVAQVFVFAGRRDKKQLRSSLRRALLPWQIENAEKSDAESLVYAGKTGPVFVVRPQAGADEKFSQSHSGRLEKSQVARSRDHVGSLLPQILGWKTSKLVIHFAGTTAQEEHAALLGLELASYSFQENRDNPKKPKKKLPQILLLGSTLSATEIRSAGDLGLAMNLARHLTNLPASVLNPTSYSEAIETVFDKETSASVEVWAGERLRRERCHLLEAVGGAAAEGPRLVRIRYRPESGKGKRPVAIVGKGITFDTGGLDIKPSSAMRWMKKDMGGSAAVLGLAYWAVRSKLAQPLDLYLALAENAVGAGSFRPGDIITARNGMTIEIHNTDAEGRLVLADALDVATTQAGADTPVAIVNLATLTGAIKVALGSDIAGLFSNHDGLSELIEAAGAATGELTWRMPLYQPYRSLLRSTFSDMANASDGFAGAITAALFLQQFVGKVPWAHLDIYAWKDSASGAWTESGGSGQGVQLLAELLANWNEQGLGA